MDTSKNTINLSQIAYPVYSIIGDAVPNRDGTVSYTYSEQENEENEILVSFKVIDDTSEVGTTLGQRRLRIQAKGSKLQKIGRAVFFLGDLVKIAKRERFFIDSVGRVFQYKKSIRAKLTFKRVQQIIPIPTGGAILEIEGIPSRFKCLFLPRPLEKFAGVLEIGRSYILYGLYEQPYKSTWRMV